MLPFEVGRLVAVVFPVTVPGPFWLAVGCVWVCVVVGLVVVSSTVVVAGGSIITRLLPTMAMMMGPGLPLSC